MNGINNLFRLLFSGKSRCVWAGLRRRFLYYFRIDYVNAQLARRKGVCLGQGHCCRLTIPWCAYFENARCSIYDKQPFFCKVFPIDERDKELSNVKGVCGYYFGNE